MNSRGSLGSEATDSDAFEEMIDGLYESRAASKMQALRGLVQMMSSYVLQEECAARETTLCRAFSQSVKRGRDELPTLASRGFSLLVLTLGLEESATRVWDTIQSDFIPKSLSGKTVALRCACAETYALGCFVVEEDFFKIQSVMDTLSALWKNSNGTLVTSAVRGWSLILSSFTANMIAGSGFEEEICHLRQMLESADSDLQEAAGTALALLYTFGFGGCGDEEGEVSEEGSDSASTTTCTSQMDETRDRLKDLSTGRNARKSKKDRASQKAAFRNICSFMEDGGVRETKIKLQYGDVLKLTSLEEQIQMDFLRSVLGTGFHRHLHENPLMHLIFNFRPTNVIGSTKMTKVEKRYHKSPSSWMNKLRTQTRDWERSEKRVYLQNNYL